MPLLGGLVSCGCIGHSVWSRRFTEHHLLYLPVSRQLLSTFTASGLYSLMTRNSQRISDSSHRLTPLSHK